MNFSPSLPKRKNSSYSSRSLFVSKSSFSTSTDNSLQKSVLTKRKQQLYLDHLIKEKNRIIGLKEIRKMHEKLIVYKPNPSLKAEKLAKRNKAAVKIQKIVRGWLVRKMYEANFVKISQQVTSIYVQDLCNSIPSLLLLGRNCLIAAKKIQKAFRYCKLRRKIAYLQKAYEVMVKYNTKTQAKRLLRRYMKTCRNKVRVWEAREELYRKLRLFCVRMNLAKCTIKNYMVRNGVKVCDITLAYKMRRLTLLGISLVEPKENSDENKKKSAKVLSRVYVQAYKPILSQKGSRYYEPYSANLRSISRLHEPTQASSSRTRIKYRFVHQRTSSDFSLYSKPTRPSTPFK